MNKKIDEVVGRCLALDRGIGGQNQFLDYTAVESCLEQIETKFIRADAIKWGQVSHQYEIGAAVSR